MLLAAAYLAVALTPYPPQADPPRSGAADVVQRAAPAAHAHHPARSVEMQHADAHATHHPQPSHRAESPGAELSMPCPCGCDDRTVSAVAKLGPVLPGFGEPLRLPVLDDVDTPLLARATAPALRLPDPVPIAI